MFQHLTEHNMDFLSLTNNISKTFSDTQISKLVQCFSAQYHQIAYEYHTEILSLRIFLLFVCQFMCHFLAYLPLTHHFILTLTKTALNDTWAKLEMCWHDPWNVLKVARYLYAIPQDHVGIMYDIIEYELYILAFWIFQEVCGECFWDNLLCYRLEYI